MNYKRRETLAPMSQVLFGFKSPLASSNENENAYIINTNVLNYLTNISDTNPITINIEGMSSARRGFLNITGFKYAVKFDDNIYFGGIHSDIPLLLSEPSANKNYDVYVYSREVLLEQDTIVYKNGIRTNEYQTSIIEEETPNNIGDPDLPSVVSGRPSIEFTFITRDENGVPIDLDGWTLRSKIAKITLNDGSVPILIVDKDIKNSQAMYLSLAEYNALPESKKIDGTIYNIYDD